MNNKTYNHVLIMLYVFVVDVHVVQHRPLVHHTTRSSTMVEMTHSHGAQLEEAPTDEGDEDQCTDDLLNTFMKNKKHKLKK
jgi:hypothetical protein